MRLIHRAKDAKPDTASEARGNLMVEGIDVDGLEPFGHSFPNDYYAILPVLAASLPVLRALGVSELCATWTSSVRQGHRLFIADSDFTPSGVRILIARLKDKAEREGTLVRHSSKDGVRENLLKGVRAQLSAEFLSGTDPWRAKRQALAAWLLQKYFAGQNFKTAAVDADATKFNVMTPEGAYAGYSIQISKRPPFDVRILEMRKNSAGWIRKEFLHWSFQPKT